MSKNIDLLMTTKNKIYMENIKHMKNISFSEQLKEIFTVFLALPLEKRIDKILSKRGKEKNENVTSITMQKSHFIREDQLKKDYNLVRLIYSDLTFKKFLFYIVESHFSTNNQKTNVTY